jgi:polyhydroxyalkanoate synthesis regulator phasin
MLDFVKKSVYVGLGLATMTKDRIETFAREVAQYTKLSEEEGRKLAEYLQSESRKARESLRDHVDTLVQKALGRLPYAAKIEQLEKRVASLEAAAGIAAPPASPEAAATADPAAAAEGGK